MVSQYTKKGATKLGFLVLLKTFQRLGYFVSSEAVPAGCAQKQLVMLKGDRLKPIELVKIQPSQGNSFSYEFTPIVAER